MNATYAQLSEIYDWLNDLFEQVANYIHGGMAIESVLKSAKAVSYVRVVEREHYAIIVRKLDTFAASVRDIPISPPTPCRVCAGIEKDMAGACRWCHTGEDAS